MTGFIVACTGMVLLAVAFFAWPLLRSGKYPLPAANRWLMIILIALVVGAISTGIYTTYLHKHGGWNADNVPPAGRNENLQLLQAIRQLEAQAKESPNDLHAWLQLGAAYVSAQRADQAVTAYQHAYDISQGKEIEAINGLAEGLLMTRTEAAFTRASGLLDEALRIQPNSPKALWYGGMVALQSNNLRLARDRFRSMLALNPPERVRSMLEREVQDLDQQLGENSSADANAAHPERKLAVTVKIDPKLKAQIKSPMTLFVVARDPAQPGPPLAVQRRSSTDIPLKVELNKSNAMMPARTIDTVADTVEVVARLSASGNAIQQAGDYAGVVQYSFGKQGQSGNVTVEINQAIKRADQRLSAQKNEAAGAAPAESGRRITVNVKLDSRLQAQIKSPMTLYVLARDPNQPGPPLAVQRHMSNELPLKVELTKASAMMPSRSIDDANAVEVVARLSASGSPIQQPGDYVGSVQYSFDKQGQQGVVNIEINHQVP